MGLEEVRSGRTTGAHHETGTLVGNVFFLEARILNRFFHSDIVISRTRPHEAHLTFVDMFGHINLRHAVDLAAETVFGVFRCGNDAGFAGAQGFGDFGDIVPDGGHNAHPGDDYSAHERSPSSGSVSPVIAQGCDRYSTDFK